MATIAYTAVAARPALRVILPASLPGSWPANTNPVQAIGSPVTARDVGDKSLWPSVSGVYTDALGVHGQRRIHVYSRATGLLLGSADSHPTTGAYIVRVPYSGEVKITCQDDAAGTLENDLVLRTFPIAP